MQNTFNNIANEQINNIAIKLIAKAGIIAKDVSCQRIIRGGNNQAFRVDSKQGTFFLKYYFQSAEDTRDRLDAEFSFMHFCNEKNIKRVPIALACDKNKGYALYSWIEGKGFAMPTSEKQIKGVKGITVAVNERHINEAVLFLKDLASHGINEALGIKPASDAYFSLTEHLQSLELRIKNLQDNFVSQDTELAEKAFTILEKNIIPHWQYLEQKIKDFCINADKENIDRFILSPSDFGFHNALDTANGLVFLDFEYAGIDGPVKTLCDIVCQPDFPVHESYLNLFAKAIYEDDAKAQRLWTKAQRLLPICRVKFCCIMLNHFTKVGIARRSFANNIDMQTQQKKQLDKIQKYIKLHFIKDKS